jgi:hypothetical protein
MNAGNRLDIEPSSTIFTRARSTLRSHGFGTVVSMPFSDIRSKLRVGPFASIGEAVEWLRDQACAHYPDSEFARKYGGFL